MSGQTKTRTARGCAKLPELKDFFDRSYILDHSENYEKFLREMGVKKSVRTQAANSKPILKLSQENDYFVLTTNYPEGRQIKLKIKPGEEVRRRGVSNSTSCSVFQVLGNKLTEQLYVDGKNVSVEREFTKRDLFVTMEVNDVKCHRMFTLHKESKDSIKTETSRRSYLWEEFLRKCRTRSTLTSMSSEAGEDAEESFEDENLCY